MAARGSKKPPTGPMKRNVAIANVPRQKDADFASYYVNNAGLGTTFWDVALLFSEIQVDQEGKPQIVEKCRVAMNPAHAKALAQALLVAIKNWESEFGEIRLPAGMVKDVPKSGPEQPK